jgi:hypothetical protein
MQTNLAEKENKFATERDGAKRKESIAIELEKLAQDETKVGFHSFALDLKVSKAHRVSFLQLIEEIGPLRRKLQAKEQDKERIRIGAEETRQVLSSTLQLFQRDVQQLQDVIRLIEEYDMSDKEGQLKEMESERSIILNEIDEEKRRLLALQPEVEASRSVVKDQTQRKKLLRDNIDLIKKQVELEQHDSRIQILEDQLVRIKGRSTCHDEYKRAKLQKDKLTEEKARIDGRWDEIVEQIRSLQVRFAFP